MKSLLAGCLLTLASVCSAGTLGLHLGSVHIPQRSLNNFNPGMYYRAENNVQVGVFYNSYNRVSVYGGYSFEYKQFALTLGATTGYPKYNVLPLVVPSVKLGQNWRVALLPQVIRGGATAIHFMYEF